MSFSIPGGVVYGFNYKYIFLPVIILVGIGYLVWKKSNVRLPDYILVFSVVLVFMFFQAALVGLLNNNTVYVLDDFRLLFSVFVIFSLYYILFKDDLSFQKSFLKVAIFGVFIYNLIRIILELAFVFNLIDMASIEVIALNYGGRVPVTSPLPLSMIRLYWTEMDLVSICVAYAFFIAKPSVDVGKCFRILFYFVVFSGVIIGFSRLLMGLSLLSLFVAFLYKFGFWKTLKKSLFLFSIIILMLLDPLSQLFEKRFSDRYIATADEVRVEQVESLFEKWSEYPIAGAGFGANANVLRSIDKPYQYEIWWVSYWMKTGLVGVVVFMFLLVLPLFSKGVLLRRDDVYLLFIYYVFILSSFTNQYMPSSISAFVFVLIYFSFNNSNKKVIDRSEYV